MVGGNKQGDIVLVNNLQKSCKSKVNSFYGGDNGIHVACVTNHVAIREVAADKVIFF